MKICVDANNVETYILGDFNINLWQDGHHFFQKHTLFSCHSVSNDIKNYFDLYTMFGLKQLIGKPARITCSSSQCVKSVHIRSYFWSVFPCISSNTGKYGPEIIPYLDTFHEVSSIIDHILAISPDRIAQRGILNVGLSDHQLIYYTKKLPE